MFCLNLLLEPNLNLEVPFFPPCCCDCANASNETLALALIPKYHFCVFSFTSSILSGLGSNPVNISSLSNSTISSSNVCSKNQYTVGALTGLGIGILGGAVGLILGSIRLPVLVRILRMDPRVVAGTNMMIGFSLGSMGWIAHATRGEVDYLLLYRNPQKHI